MVFLAILVVALLVTLALPARYGGRSIRVAARRAMAVAFIFAGVSHLAMPESFEVYFPSWVPFVEPIIYATGVIEIAGGLALFSRRYQARVGLVLAVYLVLVFPANVYVAVAGVEEELPGLPYVWWYPWARLPFQALYIWWLLRSTGAAIPASRAIWPLSLAGAGR
jgi:uncharacterized membrane protein